MVGNSIEIERRKLTLNGQRLGNDAQCYSGNQHAVIGRKVKDHKERSSGPTGKFNNMIIAKVEGWDFVNYLGVRLYIRGAGGVNHPSTLLRSNP